MADSPRWCDRCQEYGDHHTDRHPPLNENELFTLAVKAINRDLQAGWAEEAIELYNRKYIEELVSANLVGRETADKIIAKFEKEGWV